MSFVKWLSALKNRSRNNVPRKPRPRFTVQVVQLEDRWVPAYIPTLPDVGTKQGGTLSDVLYVPELDNTIAPSALPEKKLVTIMNNSDDLIFPILYGSNSTPDLTAGTVTRAIIDPANRGTGWQGKYRIEFNPGSGLNPVGAVAIADGNDILYAITLQSGGSGYLPGDNPTIKSITSQDGQPLGTGAVITAHVSNITPAQNGKVALYDPKDALDNTYRGYIGERVNGVNQLGLRPGHQVTVQVPPAFWDGGRMYMINNGPIPITSQYDPAYPLQANGVWTYNPSLTPNPLFGLGAGLSYIVAPGSTFGYGADFADPSTGHANPDGIIMWYHEANSKPRIFGLSTPAVLTEATFRDPNQPSFAPNMRPDQILLIDNYDVSYVDSLALPASMEATQVPTIPPTPGSGQFSWLGSDLSNTQMQQAIAAFTANNPGNGLGTYFGGLGWDQFYVPPDIDTGVSGTIARVNNPNADGKFTTPVTIITPPNGTAGLVNGQLVKIEGVTSGQDINGTWTIGNITPSSFALSNLAGTNAAIPENMGTWTAVASTGIHTLKIPAGYDAIKQSPNLNVESQFNSSKFSLVSGGGVKGIDTFSTGEATQGLFTIKDVSTEYARQMVAGMIFKAANNNVGQPLFPVGTTIASIKIGTEGQNDSVITMNKAATASGSPANAGKGGSFGFVGSIYTANTPPYSPPAAQATIAANSNVITGLDPDVVRYLRPGMLVTGNGLQTATNTYIQSIDTSDYTKVTLTQNGTAAGGSGPYNFVGAPSSYIVQTLVNNWYAWADYYVAQLASGPAAAPSGTFAGTTMTLQNQNPVEARKEFNSLLITITDANFDMNTLRIGDVVTATGGILTPNTTGSPAGTPNTPGYDPSLNYTIVSFNSKERTVQLSLPVAVTTATAGTFTFSPPQYIVRSSDAPAAAPKAISSIGTTNGQPITINTTSTAGLVAGVTQVTVAGVTNLTTNLPASINGQFIVTNVTANSFQLQGTSGLGESFSVGIWSTSLGATEHTLNFNVPSNGITSVANPNGGVITIQTASTVGLTAGQQITISGVTGGQNINGLWTVTNITAGSFDLLGITGNIAGQGGPTGNGSTPTPGTGTWSPANALQFAQTVYDTMQTFSLLVDPTTLATRSATLVGYIIGGNTGSFVINEKYFNQTGRHTLLPDERTARELRDEVKSLLRGVYNFNVVQDQSKWYPNPATATPGATLNGQAITFGIYNLDPYVWFVHEVLHNSSYGFSFDDDVANAQAASSTLQIAVGGNAYTAPTPAAPFNHLPNFEGFAPWAQYGTQTSQGFIDTTSPAAIANAAAGQITINGLDQSAVARLSQADPVKDHPGAHITSDFAGIAPDGATIIITRASIPSVVNQTISSITANGTKIRITTSQPTGALGEGDVVIISDVTGGSPAINGRWIVEGVTPTSFDLKDSTFTGPYTGGTWSWYPSFVTFKKPDGYTPPTDNALHQFTFSAFFGTTVPANITSSVPKAPPGTVVTISGTGLTGVYGVSFNGYPAEIVGVPTDTAVQVMVPTPVENTATSTHPGRIGKFAVRNQSGTVYSAENFEIGDAGLTVTPSTTDRAQNAPTLVIHGTGFDAVTPGNNTVAFNLGAVGTVTAATATQLTVTFSTQPTSLGSLTAIVTANGENSGAAVQVATIVAPPAVTPNTADHPQNDHTLIIAGTGFDATAPGNNTVEFNLGAVGTVTAATATQLTVTFSTTPTSLGSLTAVVTSHGGTSGSPVQVANVVSADAPTVTANTADRAQNASTLIINGTGFDTSAPGNNTVVFNLGAIGAVTAATATQLTVTFSTQPTSLGSLTAVVTAHGQNSGAPVQVATIVAPPTVTLSTADHEQDATTIVINGTGFDASAPGNNTVVFNLGAAGTVTAATATQLTVTFSTVPTSLGTLTAIVTSHGGTSGAAVQVANVVADAPIVTASTANRAQNAPTLVIHGTGFDATSPGNNTVAFNLGAAGTVTSATSTQLIVTFTTAPTSLGDLTAIVTSHGQSSGAAVQVATIVAPPTVTPSTANQAQNDATLFIIGTGFDATSPGDNIVAFNLGAVGHVTAATATQLTVLFTTLPTSLGALTAVVTSNGGESGAATQVATVVAAVAAPTVTMSTIDRAQNAPTLVINGTGFDPSAPGNNTVAFDLGAAGTVTAATATQLTVTFTTLPTSLGVLRAIVTANEQTSGAPVQVATIVAAPTVTVNTANRAQSAPTLVINGSGFDASTPGNNTVVFNLGAVGAVTAATATQLTVTFSTQPTSLGSLTAIVTSHGGTSGAAVQVATVVNAAAPTVTASTTYQSRDATTMIIHGTGFDASVPGNNTVAFNLGAVGAVTAATATQLTVTFSTTPTLGNLTAVVTSNGLTSGAPVQVATVVTPDERFVQALYRDVLGREGSKDEVDFWANRVPGEGRSIAVFGIEHSVEARRHLVADWYQSYLGRSASPAEAAAWADELLFGRLTEQQALNAILAGPEYFTRAQTFATGPSPDARFVRLLFQDLLGRPGSDAEVASWSAQVPSKGTAGVALGILASLEARGVYVERLYLSLLHRPCSPEERAAWVATPLDEMGLRTAIQESNEFYFFG